MINLVNKLDIVPKPLTSALFNLIHSTLNNHIKIHASEKFDTLVPASVPVPVPLPPQTTVITTNQHDLLQTVAALKVETVLKVEAIDYTN